MILLRILLIAIVIFAVCLLILPKTAKEKSLERKTFKVLLAICCGLVGILLVTLFQFKDTLWADDSNSTIVTNKIKNIDYNNQQLALTKYDFQNMNLELLEKITLSKKKLHTLELTKMPAEKSPLVAKILNVNSNIQTIKLYKTAPAALTSFFVNLQTNGKIKHLILQQHFLQPNNIKSLAATLKQQPQLLTLDLQNNKLRDDGIQYLADYLQHTKNLKTLILRNNQITDTGAKILLNALRFNTSLQRVDLWGNQINDHSMPMLAKTLAENKTITALKLGYNHISDQGTIDLAQGIKNNSSLTWLELNRNPISDQGLHNILNALSENTSITTLLLKTETISETGMELLHKTMQKRN